VEGRSIVEDRRPRNSYHRVCCVRGTSSFRISLESDRNGRQPTSDRRQCGWCVVITARPRAERSTVMSVSVCPRSLSSELHVRSSPNVLCTLPMAVAPSYSGGVVMRYVLPVLWMTSYLLISQGCSNVAAQLKRSAHAALGLAINCAQ